MSCSALPELRLESVSSAKALAACRAWHYSKSVAIVSILCLGVWEGPRFVGVVVFGSGACPSIGRPYGLFSPQICELTRVALDRHDHPVTRIVSVAMGLLRKHRPKLRLLVSYADTRQGHVGAIYQAGNWIYVGPTKSDRHLLCPDGVIRHGRTAFDYYPAEVRLKCPKVWMPPKHKYLYPLDESMRSAILDLRKSHPKASQALPVDAPTYQVDQGGSIPTATLQAALSHQKPG